MVERKRDEGGEGMRCPKCGESLAEGEDIYFCPRCNFVYKWVKAPVGVDEDDDWEAEE